MFNLPLELVPNRVVIKKLPALSMADSSAPDGIVKRSLLLGEIAYGGVLELVFENYTTKRSKVLNPPGHDPEKTGACGQTEAGWVGAWDFYRKTLDGFYAFTIPDAHELWEMVDYRDEWLKYGLDGLPVIYKITEQPVPTIPKEKGTSNFSLVIEQSLRTPRHT